MDLEDFIAHDATAIVDAVRARVVGPVEVVEAALAAVERLDPPLNACVLLLADEAREAARVLERRDAAASEMPLVGVPVAIKDAIWLKDAPATMGTRALQEFVPAMDAASVRHLRDAGAIVVAKTANPPLLDAGYTAKGTQWNHSKSMESRAHPRRVQWWLRSGRRGGHGPGRLGNRCRWLDQDSLVVLRDSRLEADAWVSALPGV